MRRASMAGSVAETLQQVGAGCLDLVWTRSDAVGPIPGTPAPDKLMFIPNMASYVEARLEMRRPWSQQEEKTPHILFCHQNRQSKTSGSLGDWCLTRYVTDGPLGRSSHVNSGCLKASMLDPQGFALAHLQILQTHESKDGSMAAPEEGDRQSLSKEAKLKRAVRNSESQMSQQMSLESLGLFPDQLLVFIFSQMTTPVVVEISSLAPSEARLLVEAGRRLTLRYVRPSVECKSESRVIKQRHEIVDLGVGLLHLRLFCYLKDS